MGEEIYCIRIHIPVAIKQPHVSVPLCSRLIKRANAAVP